MVSLKYLVLAIILIGDQVFPDSVADIVTLLAIDAENPLSEEELLALDELLQSSGKISHRQLELFGQLSFISDGDMDIIRRNADIKKFSGVENLSANAASLIQILNSSAVEYASALNFRQMAVFGNGLRYRWRGQITGPGSKVGFLMERDPGEQQIADYYSGYLQLDFNSSKLIIGDHQILFGYGLNLWRSTPAFTGFESIRTAGRSGTGLRPYRSSSENWSLRGIAWNKQMNKLDLIISWSRNNRDGKFIQSELPLLNFTGDHTSNTAQNEKGNLIENVFCGVGTWQSGKNSLGFSAATVSISDSTSVTFQQPAFSIFVKNKTALASKFFEIGHGYYDSRALITGFNTANGDLKYAVILRYFTNDYWSVRSNPSAEWSGRYKNELGVFQGLLYRFDNQSISIFGDLHHQTMVPSDQASSINGSELALRWEWQRGTSKVRIQNKYSRKTVEEIKYLFLSNKPHYFRSNLFKLVYYYNFNRQFRIKTQFNNVIYSEQTGNFIGRGFELLLARDFKFIRARLDLVYVQNYHFQSRVYFWDLNLPGEMRSRMYTSSGFYPGIYIEYRRDELYRIAFRLRLIYPDGRQILSAGNEGGLVIDVFL